MGQEQKMDVQRLRLKVGLTGMLMRMVVKITTVTRRSSVGSNWEQWMGKKWALPGNKPRGDISL